MDFRLDLGDGRNRIHAYEPGKITVNEKVYSKSVIISPNQIIPNWDINHSEELNEDEVKKLLELNPDVVLLGTGENLVFPSVDVFMPLSNQQIGIEVMTTAAACRTYNVLMAEGRNVVAAMIIK